MRYAEPINYIQQMLQTYVEQFKDTSPVINIALADVSTRHWQTIVQALAVYDSILTHKEEANGLNVENPDAE